MIIKNIIRALLAEESVFLNNLGVFRCTRQEATIKENRITPPRIVILFEEDNDANGFAFVTRLSQWEQISFIDANGKTNQWIEELISAIEHNQSITYNNFGTFSRGKKGEILFESSYIPELNLEYEGMNPLVINPNGILTEEVTESEPYREEETHTEETGQETAFVAPIPEIEEPAAEEAVPEVAETATEPTADVEPETQETVTATEETTFVAPIPEIEGPEEVPEEQEIDEDEEEVEEPVISPKKKGKRRWDTLLFIIIILASIGILVALFDDELISLYHKLSKKQKADTELPISETEESATDETDEYTEIYEDEYLESEVGEYTDVTEPSVEETIPEEPVVQEVEQTPQPTTTNGAIPIIEFEKGKFYVIAGSFVKQSDVEQHIKNKQLQRYGVSIVKQSGNNRLRVCIGIFESEDEAINFAANIDKNYWVLK